MPGKYLEIDAGSVPVIPSSLYDVVMFHLNLADDTASLHVD
jgi:hypothetical protein